MRSYSSGSTPGGNGPTGPSPVGAGTSALVRSRRPCGIELAQEQPAPILLVALADRTGGLLHSPQGAEEPAVLRVDPTHWARPAPTVRPEPVEAAVIADAERGVRLDVVARETAELRP